jgi:hypothetical protein
MIALLLAAVLVLLPLTGQDSSAGGPARLANIGSRRELFVDRYLIDRMQGTELRLQTPVDKGVAFKLDEPWEGRFSIYTTVLRDTDRFRMYYRGMPGVPPEAPDVRFTCYAESRDGIHWTKPDLGMFEVYGTRHNNVIVAGDAQTSGIFTPFIDTRPGVPESERYKATGGSIDPGLYLLSSPDGLHWSKMNVPLIRPPQKGPGLDSQDVVFWSETEQMYVCYFRTVKSFGPGERPSQTGGEPWAVRWVSRTTSKDLQHWTPPVEMSFGDAPPEHLYTNQTSPYFRAPHIYVGLAARFWPGRQALSDVQAQTIRAHARYYKDIS